VRGLSAARAAGGGRGRGVAARKECFSAAPGRPGGAGRDLVAVASTKLAREVAEITVSHFGGPPPIPTKIPTNCFATTSWAGMASIF